MDGEKVLKIDNSMITILPPQIVTADALGFADIWDLIGKLREISKKFQDGVTFDTVGDGARIVLVLFGLSEEAELANLFVDQLANLGDAIRDTNGAEILLRRKLADRFLPKGVDFTLLAVPAGVVDNRDATKTPLPDHVAFARLAGDLEQHLKGIPRAAADAPLKEYDPKMIPPIVWQIGGQLLFRLIAKLIERRLGKAEEFVPIPQLATA